MDSAEMNADEAALTKQKSDRRERGWGRRNVPGGQTV